MADCEIVRAGAELRAAPPHEPLASCAFEWPAGWDARGFSWFPPPLFVPSPLLRLARSPDDVLDVWVGRFGVEIDGLAFLEKWLGRPLDDRGWRGLAIARGALDGTEWRVVLSGPAVHVLGARGEARAHVDRAAATLHSLTGLGPQAEPVRPIDVGPLRCLRLGAWAPERVSAVPHGHHRVHLRLTNAAAEVVAYLRLHVVDRRVHVGADPLQLLTTVDEEERSAGLAASPYGPDPGACGPAVGRPSSLEGVPVEVRRALRQIGPGLAVVSGVWPAPRHAPVAWLNGRRAFDLAVATLRP
jgi:hypothetical protein